jgi:hypothetical protein
MYILIQTVKTNFLTWIFHKYNYAIFETGKNISFYYIDACQILKFPSERKTSISSSEIKTNFFFLQEWHFFVGLA